MLFPTAKFSASRLFAVRFEKEKKKCASLFSVYFASADLPLTHHKPPFSLYFAVTPHLPQRQPACLTVSLALPMEQKKPPVRGDP